jgi:SAM-dependent methyltransferase
VSLPRLGIRRRVATTTQRLRDLTYWRSLRRLESGRPSAYREYLDTQLRRSLTKRANDPGVGARVLVDQVAERAGTEGDVLCIGCRNGIELDEFRARGFESVTGIDLFSQRPDILVMDMHDLTFADESFDVVYASHSLEHAYDLEAVIRGIARVGRDGAVVGVEVPVRYRASTADRIEFAGIDALRTAFEPYVAEELWAEEQPANSPTNAQGSDVARLVVRLAK